MAPTFAPLAYPLQASFDFGITDIGIGKNEEVYAEVGTDMQEKDTLDFGKSKVSTYAEIIAPVSLNFGIPRIGSGGIVLELQDRIDSQTVAFTSKLIACFWLLAIPFWPLDMITFAFAFSTLLIGIDRAWLKRKKDVLEFPKQLGLAVALCIFCFWVLGMADIMINWVWSDYDKNWLRQFGVGIFIVWGLSVLAKWAIYSYYAISSTDIMQKRLGLIMDVIRGKHDDICK